MSRATVHESHGGDRTNDWLDMSLSNRAHKDAQQRTIKRLAEYSTAAYRAEYEQIPVQYRAEYKRPVDQRRVFKKWHGKDSVEAQVYDEEISGRSGVKAASMPISQRPRVDPDTLKDYSPPAPRRPMPNANDFSGRPPRKQGLAAKAERHADNDHERSSDLNDMFAEFESQSALGPTVRISVAITCIATLVLTVVYFI